VSKRNSKAGKARRRAERARQVEDHQDLGDLVEVQSLAEVEALARRGECLPCGCDAHELLHEMLDDL
jgi:hypothetical protein